MLRKQRWNNTGAGGVCPGQFIPFWISRRKENNLLTWNAGSVLWFLSHSKGQLLKIHSTLLLKQSAWFKYKMSWKFIHAKQDIDDDSCVTLVLGGTTIDSWHQTDITILLKVAPIPTLSNLWDTLSLDRRGTTGDTRRRFSSSLFSLVWFAQEKDAEQSFSEVPGKLCSGRRSWVCVCVHFLVFVMLIHRQVVSLQLNFVPVSGSRPLLFGVCLISTVYWLSCIFPALITEELLIEHLTSELKLFQKCLPFPFFYSDFDFYVIL